MQLIVQKVSSPENYHIFISLNFSSDVSDVIFLFSVLYNMNFWYACLSMYVYSRRCVWKYFDVVELNRLYFGSIMSYIYICGEFCMENYNTKFRFIILINLLYVWGWFPFIKQYFKLDKSNNCMDSGYGNS